MWWMNEVSNPEKYDQIPSDSYQFWILLLIE